MNRPELPIDHVRAAGVEVDPGHALSYVEPFVDYLLIEFEIPDSDRAELVDAIEIAAMAYEGAEYLGPQLREWRDNSAGELDKLDGLIQQTLALCGKLRSQIATELAEELSGAALDAADRRVGAFLDELELIGRATTRSVESRLRKDPRGRKRKDALRSMIVVLRDYWVGRLHRDFKQDKWAKGAGDRREPPTPATRFVFAIVEFLAPGQGDGLRTIAREVTRKAWPLELTEKQSR